MKETILDQFRQLVREQGERGWESLKTLLQPQLEAVPSPDQTWRYITVGTTFTERWSEIGRPLFKLDHSIAAMLSVTRAPDVDWTRLPMPLFVVEVPHEFAPVYANEGKNCRIAIGWWREPGHENDWFAVGVFCDADVGIWVVRSEGTANREDMFTVIDRPDDTIAINRALRIAFNTVEYVNSQQDRVEPSISRKDGTSSRTYLVRAPRDVVVSREFRVRAAELARSSTFAGARRALAHIVRGHWRNQPVGEGRQERRLIWVRPHMRGDESLGRVVSRVERITGKQ